MIKKIISAVTAFSILIPTAFAAPVKKEEVIYTTLDAYGRQEQTVVVNSFAPNGSKSIIDYGTYKNIKNLSTADKPDINSGKITWNLSENKDMFYYQGEVGSAELPWNFSFSYMLDKKSIAPESLIGKSGKVKITVTAETNSNVKTYFANNYMAQISVSFDSKQCSNIVCSDAVIADVGSAQRLTLMILPGRSKTFEITMDTTNFETDGFTIAIVRLSDGLLGNSSDTLKNSMSEMTNGIAQLIDGNGSLKNGVDDLASGIGYLNRGAQSFSLIIPSLESGISELSNGSQNLYSGLNTLAFSSGTIRGGLSELDSQSNSIANGISAISGGLKEMTKKRTQLQSGVEQLKKQKESIATLSDGGKTLTDGYSEIETGLKAAAAGQSEIKSALGSLEGVSTDISAISGGLSELDGGMSSISDGCDIQLQILNRLSQAAQLDANLAPYAQYIAILTQAAQGIKDGASSASSGISELKNGVDTAQKGIDSLYDAAKTFGNTALKLSEGSQTMYDGITKLNSGLKSYTDGAGSVQTLYGTALAFGESALSLMDGADRLSGGVSALDNGFAKYADGVGTLAENYVNFDSGLFSAVSGADSLKTGMSNLEQGVGSVTGAVSELSDGIGRLDDGASQLSPGAEALEEGIEELYAGVNLSGESIANLVKMSSDAEVISFAAPNLAKPEKVQFLIKTEALKLPDKVKEETITEKKNFFQKLIELFKGRKDDKK